jgi:CCR4-NOT transcriptional complex subunit CAF120
VDGQIQGHVWIRLAGQTDWRKLWMVVCQGKQLPALPPSADQPSSSHTRKSSLKFPFRKTHGRAVKSTADPIISFYSSQNSKEDENPVLTIRRITQTFAVFPHRQEWIKLSAIIKLEGTIGQEEMAQTMKGREGWLLMMPEVSSASHKSREMLKWITGAIYIHVFVDECQLPSPAIHDAFELYGRPLPYVWDVSNPRSLYFAYPTGRHQYVSYCIPSFSCETSIMSEIMKQLFFDPDSLTSLDPRDASTSSVYYKLLNLLVSRINAAKTGAK